MEGRFAIWDNPVPTKFPLPFYLPPAPDKKTTKNDGMYSVRSFVFL